MRIDGDIYEMMRSFSFEPLGLEVSEVMREAAIKVLGLQGNTDPTDEEINEFLDLWLRKSDGDNRVDIVQYYQAKISELENRLEMAATILLVNIPARIACIEGAPENVLTSVTTTLVYLSIQNDIINAKAYLLDCTKICEEISIDVPTAITIAIDTLDNVTDLIDSMTES